jgi:hypothetical protein
MAAHKRYRNSDARAHIKVQMRSAEIPASKTINRR